MVSRTLVQLPEQALYPVGHARPQAPDSCSCSPFWLLDVEACSKVKREGLGQQDPGSPPVCHRTCAHALPRIIQEFKVSLGLSPTASRDEKSFPHPQPSPITQSTSTVESKLPSVPLTPPPSLPGCTQTLEPSPHMPAVLSGNHQASQVFQITGKYEIGGSLRSGPAPHLQMRRQASRKTPP